jgi:RNA polymerase sigma factor (sigma-70 family)
MHVVSNFTAASLYRCCVIEGRCTLAFVVRASWRGNCDSQRERALRDEIKADAKVANDASVHTPPTEADLLRCGPGLQVMLYRLTRDSTRTKDLAQEVMIAALIALRAGKIATTDSLPNYVREAARNAVLSAARRPNLEVCAQDADLESLEDASASPLDLYEKIELGQLAGRVLDELPNERDRQVLHGYYVLDKSKTELMHELQLTKAHFDKVLSRARLRMRELMKQHNENRPREVSVIGNSSVLDNKGVKR